jgi:hypothetical protein
LLFNVGVTSTDTTTTTDTTTDTVTNLLLPLILTCLMIITLHSFVNVDCFLPPPFSPVPV